MKLILLLHVVLCGISIVIPITEKPGDNNCENASPLTHCAACLANRFNVAGNIETLGGYLGRGYNVLTAEATMSIFDEEYRSCHRILEPVYVVPDNCNVQVLSSGGVSITADVYTTFRDYLYNSSKRIGGQNSSLSANVAGAFRRSFAEMKDSLDKKKNVLIQVIATYEKYKVDANYLSFNAEFRARLDIVGSAIRSGLIRKARYLVEEIYHDYGTDVVTSVVLGTRFERQVVIGNEMIKYANETVEKLKKSLIADMENSALKNSANRHVLTADQTNNIKTDSVHVWGGPDFEAFASNNIERLLRDDGNIAPLSYETVPFFKVIHDGTLQNPSMNETHIMALSDLLRDVYEETMERNTHRGCTDIEFYNYDYLANVDDGSCEGSTYRNERYHYRVWPWGETVALDRANNWVYPYGKMNKIYYDMILNVSETYTNVSDKIYDVHSPEKWSNSEILLTGFYQKCAPSNIDDSLIKELTLLARVNTSFCEAFQTKNLQTDDFSCPRYSKAKLIKRYDYAIPEHVVDIKCDETSSIVVVLKATVTIEAYWCELIHQSNFNKGGLYYGGSFLNGQFNAYEGSEECGTNMTTVRLFHEINLCVSTMTHKNLSDVPEIRSIIKSRNESCQQYESKEFLAIIDREQVFACVYKKQGYNDAPGSKLMELPFRDLRKVFDSRNVMIFNGESSTLTQDNYKIISETFRKNCNVTDEKDAETTPTIEAALTTTPNHETITFTTNTPSTNAPTTIIEETRISSGSSTHVVFPIICIVIHSL